MEGIELPPDGHLFTLAPAAVIPEDAHIYLLFDDYTQIFFIPRRRGYVFFICIYVYCSAIKTSLKRIVIACKISHSFTVPTCDWQAWTISMASASAFDETSKNDASQVTLGGNKHNGDRERRKSGIDQRHNSTEQKYVKYIHTQLSPVILIV